MTDREELEALAKALSERLWRDLVARGWDKPLVRLEEPVPDTFLSAEQKD